MAQRAIGDALDAVAQRHAHRHRQQHAQQQYQQRRKRRGQQYLYCRQRNHRAHHHHFAVRKVDQAEYAIDHGVAERDQRVHAALHQAVDYLLQQNIHWRLQRKSDTVSVAFNRK
jgi:uncharacterized protein (DUF1919 family)